MKAANRTDPVKARTRQMHAALKRRAGVSPAMSLEDIRAEFDFIMRTKPWCPYCRAKLSHVNVSLDHKVPVKRGGGHLASNIVLCCRSCNKIKGEMTDAEFTDLIRLLHEWSVRHRNLKLYDDVLTTMKVGNSFRIGAQRRAKG